MRLNQFFILISRLRGFCFILCSVCAASGRELTPSRPPAPLLQSRGSDFITVLLQSSVSHRRSLWSREEIRFKLQIRNESEPLSGFPMPWEFVGEEVYSHNKKDYSASATASATALNLISNLGYRYVSYVFN